MRANQRSLPLFSWSFKFWTSNFELQRGSSLKFKEAISETILNGDLWIGPYYLSITDKLQPAIELIEFRFESSALISGKCDVVTCLIEWMELTTRDSSFS